MPVLTTLEDCGVITWARAAAERVTCTSALIGFRNVILESGQRGVRVVVCQELCCPGSPCFAHPPLQVHSSQHTHHPQCSGFHLFAPPPPLTQ